MVVLMVEFQEININLNNINELRNELNYLKSVNVLCFSGFISKLIIIVTININNINYVVSYHFKHKNYFTFFNKELRNL